MTTSSSWKPLPRVSDLFSCISESRSKKSVCFITASRSCFLCKLVEPKIRSFAEDVSYDDIDFFVIDVEDVEDVDRLPEDVSTLPTFLLFDAGELKERVPVTSQKRPGRVLSKAIQRVFCE